MFCAGAAGDVERSREDGGVATEAVIWRDEVQARMQVLVVVPVHEDGHPASDFVDITKWSIWESWSVLQCTKECFWKWIVVAHARSAEGSDNAKPLQRREHRC